MRLVTRAAPTVVTGVAFSAAFVCLSARCLNKWCI